MEYLAAILANIRLRKLSSRSRIGRGLISCAPHTSFDETNDSVVKSERGVLARGFDSTLGVQCSHHGRWRVAGADQACDKNAFGG